MFAGATTIEVLDFALNVIEVALLILGVHILRRRANLVKKFVHEELTTKPPEQGPSDGS